MILCIACKDEPSISEIPQINFQKVSIYKNIKGNDSMIVLSIDYQDGNGDVGLDSKDTFPPFNYGGKGFYNLFVTYHVYDGLSWQSLVRPLTLDTINYHQRIPRLNQSESPRRVSGTLDLRIPASPYPGIKPSKVKFGCTLLDRNFNVSNTIQSTDINLKH